MYQFNHCAVFDDMDIEENQSALEKDLDAAKALYSFILKQKIKGAFTAGTCCQAQHRAADRFEMGARIVRSRF